MTVTGVELICGDGFLRLDDGLDCREDRCANYTAFPCSYLNLISLELELGRGSFLFPYSQWIFSRGTAYSWVDMLSYPALLSSLVSTEQGSRSDTFQGPRFRCLLLIRCRTVDGLHDLPVHDPFKALFLNDLEL